MTMFNEFKIIYCFSFMPKRLFITILFLCLQVEMASILTFSAKTMVRAFVQYYRKSLDILETTESVRDGFSHYYTDKFYVKHRSYGTLEIIIVQFRFRSRKETELARELKQQSNFMSDFMKKLEREVGIPRIVLVSWI